MGKRGLTGSKELFSRVTITHPKGCLHKKRVQLPQDWFGTSTWPLIHYFKAQIRLLWRHMKILHRFIVHLFRCYTLIFIHITSHASASCYLLWSRLVIQLCINRPFSKMAAENSNKLKLSKLKIVYQHYRKTTFALVTLQSFSISGVILAEKM